MDEKLVTIAEYPSYIEAEMARQMLADYGIEAFATGENAANLYPISAIDGPKLQVLESKVQQAIEILQNHTGTDNDTPNIDTEEIIE